MNTNSRAHCWHDHTVIGDDSQFCCRCSARLLGVPRRGPLLQSECIHLPTCPGETLKGLCVSMLERLWDASPGRQHAEDTRFVEPTTAMVEERRTLFGESW